MKYKSVCLNPKCEKISLIRMKEGEIIKETRCKKCNWKCKIDNLFSSHNNLNTNIPLN